MTVVKSSKYKTQQRANAQPIHTKISFILIILTVAIMGYMGLRHLNDIDAYGQLWGKYALVLHSIMCISAYIIVQMINNQPLIPKRFKQLDINTGIYTTLLIMLIMMTQIISKQTLSIDSSEQAIYYVFSAISEEVIFRLMIITLALKFNNSIYMKLSAILLSAFTFTIYHQNYYNDIQMLIAIFISGLIFATFYIYTQDITSNILAHFIINLIAAGSFLVNLT